MPTIIDATASDDVVIDSPEFAALPGRIALSGGDNRLHIGPNVQCTSINIVMHGDATLNIEGYSILGRLDCYLSKGSTLLIERDSAFNGAVNLYQHETSKMKIGRNCLFGGGTLLTTSDMHSIIRVNDGHRVNPAADIIIGEHVWLGAGVTVVKGVSIGGGSVVGINSVVGRSVRSNCLVAGNPAVLLREGITWKPELT